MTENLDSTTSLLRSLEGKSLLYAIKSPDTELYDFGFGKTATVMDLSGDYNSSVTHTIHALCRFKVIQRKPSHGVVCYYEDTPCDEFYSRVQCLIGQTVMRVALSEKNDLWLDLGNYWIVFATFENNEESWRFFTSSPDEPHIVASNGNLELV